MLKCSVVLIAVLLCAAIPATADANARLINVTAVDGGCVSGPTGPAVQAWDVEPGKTYTITISNVTECANGGTDATLNVRVNSSSSGNTDVVATLVAAGTYQFNFTVPGGAACTLPIFYCTTPGDNSSGIFVTRNDGGPFQAHLRAATFQAGCTNPQEIFQLPWCGVVPVEPTTWGHVKALYR
jgi:hypothetical protein